MRRLGAGEASPADASFEAEQVQFDVHPALVQRKLEPQSRAAGCPCT